MGWVFKRKELQKEKTELLIFLTPHVAAKNEDLDAITQKQNAGSKMIKESFENRSQKGDVGNIDEKDILLGN